MRVAGCRFPIERRLQIGNLCNGCLLYTSFFPQLFLLVHEDFVQPDISHISDLSSMNLRTLSKHTPQANIYQGTRFLHLVQYDMLLQYVPKYNLLQFYFLISFYLSLQRYFLSRIHI